MGAMSRLFWPAAGFLVATLVALVVRATLLTLARRWARREGPVAALADAFRLPSVLWCLVLGLWVAIEVAASSSGCRAGSASSSPRSSRSA
jgi:hypothetical protein